MENYIAQPSSLKNDELLQDKIFKELFANRIGIITQYEPTTNKASVEIVDIEKEVKDINSITNNQLPLLINVPVFRNATEQAGFTKPINVGDTVLLLFNDTNINNFLLNQAKQEPATNLRHDIDHAIAIPYDFKEWIHNNTGTEMYYNNASVSLDDTRVEIKCNDSIVSLDSKIGMRNNAQDFLTVLNQLLDTMIQHYQDLADVSNFNQLDALALSTKGNVEADKVQFNELFKAI
jgi:hypothetical protein